MRQWGRAYLSLLERVPKPSGPTLHQAILLNYQLFYVTGQIGPLDGFSITDQHDCVNTVEECRLEPASLSFQWDSSDPWGQESGEWLIQQLFYRFYQWFSASVFFSPHPSHQLNHPVSIIWSPQGLQARQPSPSLLEKHTSSNRVAVLLPVSINRNWTCNLLTSDNSLVLSEEPAEKSWENIREEHLSKVISVTDQLNDTNYEEFLIYVKLHTFIHFTRCHCCHVMKKRSVFRFWVLKKD